MTCRNGNPLRLPGPSPGGLPRFQQLEQHDLPRWNPRSCPVHLTEHPQVGTAITSGKPCSMPSGLLCRCRSSGTWPQVHDQGALGCWRMPHLDLSTAAPAAGTSRHLSTAWGAGPVAAPMQSSAAAPQHQAGPAQAQPAPLHSVAQRRAQAKPHAGAPPSASRPCCVWLPASSLSALADAAPGHRGLHWQQAPAGCLPGVGHSKLGKRQAPWSHMAARAAHAARQCSPACRARDSSGCAAAGRSSLSAAHAAAD